jgi:hypothetical protein
MRKFFVLQKVSKEAPMQVANVADVPEYEVHAEELLMCKPDPKLPEVISHYEKILNYLNVNLIS